ncbi:MAG: hypothetical protein AAFN74_02220 [Myxococcota bacterium]
MFDVAVAGLAALGSQAFVRRRRSGEYVNGVWTTGVSTDVSGIGVISPAQAADLRRLPEGRRREYAIRILTQLELRLSDQEVSAGATGGMTDLIVFDAETFEVESVQPWGGRYYDAVAVRTGD